MNAIDPRLNESGQLLQNARTLRGRAALRLLRQAVSILEQAAPLSEDLADAYRSLSFTHLFMRCRPGNRDKQQKLALSWYEKAIAVWEANGNQDALSGNLTNLGALYFRCGDLQKSLERNLRALNFERAKQKFDDESVAAWNHVAGCYVSLNRLDEAEATIRDGFSRLGENTPQCYCLWDTLAEVFEARAKQFRKKAVDLAPPQSCLI